MAQIARPNETGRPGRRPGGRSTKGPKQVDSYVGLQIRHRRNELGFSQTALGKEVGVSFQQLQKYEKGTNRVGASRLAAIAKVLGVPVGYFFPDGDTEMATTGDVAARIANLTKEITLMNKELNRLRKIG